MNATKVGKDKLSIWGGTCEAGQVLALIGNWPNRAQMPYRIWEYTSKITIGKDGGDDSEPEGYQYLERGRMFGETGDLTVRRDGEKFRWWFVGKLGTEPPAMCQEDATPYFANGCEDDTFNENLVNTALLWGSREDGRQNFWEDRVAGAPLTYPVDDNAKRVKIEYATYTRAGRVEFVWMKKLLSIHKEKSR